MSLLEGIPVSLFITRDTMIRLWSQKSEAEKRSAIEIINKIIKETIEREPIIFPATLLTNIPAVQKELIRMLREEAKWKISFLDENKNEIIKDCYDVSNYYVQLKD